MDQKSLIERLGSPAHEEVILSDIAEALWHMYKTDDVEGVHVLKRAYIKGLRSDDKSRTAGEMINMISEKLSCAAQLADQLDRSRSQGSGSKVLLPMGEDGPVSKFYLDTIAPGVPGER